MTTLDLYAGTGALTLEARSRGAVLSVAVDRDPALIRALDAAARTIGIDAVETRVGDAIAILRRERRLFDVIFLDPPFADDPWDELFAAAAHRLTDGGRIYAEAPRRLAPPAPLTVIRHARAGQVHYHLLVAAPSSPAALPSPAAPEPTQSPP